VAAVFGAKMVSASFVTLHSFYVGQSVSAGSNLTINLQLPYKYAGTLEVVVNATGKPLANSVTKKGYTVTFYFTTKTLAVITEIYPDSAGALHTNVTVSLDGSKSLVGSVAAAAGDNTGIAVNSIALEPYNLTAINLTVFLSNGQTLSKILSVTPDGLEKVTVTDVYNATYTVNSIVISRYSKYLTGLTVKDENTGALVQTFDFSDGNGYVHVFDASGQYIARNYFVSPGSTLTAYLVSYSDGGWYTIFAGPQYINQTVQILRNIDGVWTLVAEGKFDATGSTSAFLTNGATYLFRILNQEGNVVLQAEKTANPNNPTIVLAGSLTGLSVAVDKQNGFSWLLMPASGYLHANTTNTVTLLFSSAVTVKDIKLTLTGDGVSTTKLVSFNTTGGLFQVSVTPTSPSSYVYAAVTVEFSSGATAQYFKSFYVIPYTNATNQSLLHAAKEVPEQLGLGPVARTFIAFLFSLLAGLAVGRIAGEGGGLVVGSLAWITFAYLGWVDWRIVLVSVLAGVGMMIRRGEA